MAGELSRLFVSIFGDTSHLDKTLGDTEKKLKNMGQNFSNIGKKMSLFVTAPIAAIGTAALISAGKMEKQQIAFETMLGSAEKAQGLLQDIERFAATTPFQLPGLIEGSKRLIAFGIDSEDVIEKMKNLGNAAMGDEEILGRLTLAYGKVAAKGKASLEELNMFIEAGVPILESLRNQFGVTKEELFKMISEGQVTFEHVDKALSDLTTGQGQFAGMIEKQSQSLSGLFSTLKDNIGLLARSFAELAMPMIKDILSKLLSFIDRLNNMDETWRKVILFIIGTLAASGPLLMGIGSLLSVIGSIGPAIAAIGPFVTAMMGPAGLILLAVAGVVAGAILLIKHWDEVKAFFQRLWDFLKGLFEQIWNWEGLYFMPFIGIPKLIMDNWEEIRDFMENLLSAIAGFMQTYLVDRFNAIVERIRGAIEKVKGFFKGLFDFTVGESVIPEMVNAISGWFGKLGDDMKDKTDAAVETAKGIYDSFKTYMEEDFKLSFENTMESVWTSTKSFSEKIKEMVKSLIADVLRALGKKYAGLAAIMAVSLQFGKAIRYAALSAALFAMAGAVERLAKGGIVTGPTLAVVGEKEKEAVLPLNQEMFSSLAEGILNEIEKKAGRAGIPAAEQMVGGRTINLNIGTLVADDYGLKKLERKLRDIRVVENMRLGYVSG